MPKISSRELKSEPLTVKTFQDVTRIEVSEYQISGLITWSKKLSDGTELPVQTIPVSRSRATLPPEVAAIVSQFADLLEVWLQEDEAQRAADAQAEAALKPVP